MALDRFLLVNQRPGVDGPQQAEFVALGAAVEQVLVPDLDGQLANVALSLDHDDDRRDPHKNPYLGVTVGRYANRLAGPHLTFDGTCHELATNEGPNQLHGGDDGFGRQLWHGTQLASDRVRFVLTSPHGHMGFPGQMDVSVTYHLTGPALRIDLRATSDRPTICSLTNHTYWNLSADEPTVAGHQVTIDAATVVPVDAELIPAGQPQPVSGHLDLRSGRSLGSVGRDGVEYDHCFMIDGRGFRRHARVEHQKSGRCLEAWSDHPALQFYTGAHLPGTVGGGRRHVPNAGLALEPQHPPDAPHQDWAALPRLDPGHEYRHQIEYRFAVCDSATTPEAP